MNTVLQKFITIIFCLLSLSVHAIENEPVQNNKAQITILTKADIAYQGLNFALAVEGYEDYLLETKSAPKEVLEKLANAYFQMRESDQALRVYQILYPNGNQGVSKPLQIRIGELYARKGEYKLATEWLKNTAAFEAKAAVYSEKEIMNTMKKDSLLWKIGFVNLNTPYKEFSPFIIREKLIFSSNKPLDRKTRAYGWDGNNFAQLWEIPISKCRDFTVKEMSDTTLFNKEKQQKKPKQLAGIYECGDSKSDNSVLKLLMSKPYLKPYSSTSGTVLKGLDRLSNTSTLSIDQYNHVYFSANNPTLHKDSISRIVIMEGLYTPAGIREIKQLPLVDANRFSVMHPAINEKGTFMVCSSDKIGGAGAFDLYYTQRKDITQAWDTLKAFGDKINSIGNEIFPNITPNGFLYFSNDVFPGLGGLDIFRIPLKDAITNNGELEHISYPINSAADDFGWTQKDSTGSKGYFTSDRLNNNDNIYSFNFEQIKDTKKIKVGFVWKLSNVHYDFDKSELRTDAKPILDSLVKMSNEHFITIDSLVLVLNKNPITIEIGSHTDSRGSYEYNMKLAQKRAESVVAYLVEHGIDPKRITAKSYGKAKLLKREERTIDDYQANRRSEVKVTGYEK
jgi:outer membrane protein OmpA-like peptidoglycan-associated protein